MVWIKRLAAALLVLAISIVGIALISPSAVTIEREIEIDAPAATVYAQANDFRNFQLWSPWADIAPEVTQTTYLGSRRGVGAQMSWASEDARVGTGSQQIIAAEPYSAIDVALAFEGQGQAAARYEFTSLDSGKTQVLWSYHQEFGFDLVGRLLGRFFDGWIGPDYERGLKRLKLRAESLPATDFADLDVAEVTIPGVTLALIETRADPNATAVAQALGQAYFEILELMRTAGLDQAGVPRKINLGRENQIIFQAAIPVNAEPSDTLESVRLVPGYTGPALQIIHRGSYLSLPKTHDKILAYMAAYGIERVASPWESYVSDPSAVSEAELITELNYPVADDYVAGQPP